MALVVTTLAERPGLVDALEGPAFETAWPEFMNHDPIAGLYYDDLLRWAPHVIALLDDGEVIAKGFTIPFAFPTDDRQQLPVDGWDRVIRWGRYDYNTGATPTACSALGDHHPPAAPRRGAVVGDGRRDAAHCRGLGLLRPVRADPALRQER